MDPKKLPDQDRVSLENQRHLLAMRNSSALIVAAWGGHRPLPLGTGSTIAMIKAWCDVFCLGLTKQAKQPRHPLYLSYETALGHLGAA